MSIGHYQDITRTFDSRYFMSDYEISDDMMVSNETFDECDVENQYLVRRDCSGCAQLMKVDNINSHHVEFFDGKQMTNMDIVTGLRVVLTY